jgi:hypothetical protein
MSVYPVPPVEGASDKSGGREPVDKVYRPREPAPGFAEILKGVRLDPVEISKVKEVGPGVYDLSDSKIGDLKREYCAPDESFGTKQLAHNLSSPVFVPKNILGRQ